MTKSASNTAGPLPNDLLHRVLDTRRCAIIERAVDAVSRHAPETAERWFDGFVAALETLATNAAMYALAPESEMCSVEIRQMIYRTRNRRANRALYTIRESAVYILAIRRPGQDLLTADEVARAIAELD